MNALWGWRILVVGFLAFLSLVALATDLGRLPTCMQTACSFPGGDKVGHFVLYGILGFLGAKAWPRPLDTGRWTLAAGLVPAAVLASVEELTQIWMPQRSAEVLDLAAGLLGVAAAAALTAGRPRAAKAR
jgi:polysaccharide biosynthesis protein VpsQ